MNIRYVLFILSDQHRGDYLGAAGHPYVRTPNLDRLAKRGLQFNNAYTVSPICGPARASLATGQYPHEINSFGNATCYNGETPSVAHYLVENGISAASIGRMDFLPDIDHGYDAIQPRPRDRIDIAEFMRSPSVKRHDTHRMLNVEHRSNTSPPDWTRHIISWLEQDHRHDEPWHMFANFLRPHCPFVVPKKYVELYDEIEIPLPVIPEGHLENLHSALKELRFHWNIEEVVPNEQLRLIRKSYYAMITWVDDAIGTILDKLEEQGILDETLIIYSSDHGDHLGDHGMWQKCNFLESCARIPLIIAGPGVPQGQKVNTPVSLLDISPTILTAMGCKVPEDMRGQDLIALAENGDKEEKRAVFGEYHANGAVTGEFMVRQGQWKYIYYEGMRPQLFNLENDPNEFKDLGEDPDYAEIREHLNQLLHKEFGNLTELDAKIKSYQFNQFKDWWKSGSIQEKTDIMLEFAGGNQKAIEPYLKMMKG